MALVVLGLFVLVWIISAVVKASQDTGPKRPGPRPRPLDAPRAERTSNSDIDRFMAEIDRLRRKGEGLPAGRADQSRPAQRPTVERPTRAEPRPKPVDPRRDRDRERRQRQTARPAPVLAPPPLPRTDMVPVLRPVAPAVPAPPSTAASAPIKPAQTARTTATTVVSSSSPTSPVIAALQTVLRSNQGPAAGVILAEVFGEPRCRQAIRPRGI
jgi:hypothetical protein